MKEKRNSAFSKPDIRRIITDDKVSALAVMDPEKEKELFKEIQNGTYKRTNMMAFVHDSDAHCPEKIGKNTIWLKMTKPDFFGVKYALRDPDLRVLKGKPEGIEYPYIVGMAFWDSPMGMADNIWYYLRFNGSLNCLIGARGTGKSTIINWIIYSLGQSLNDFERYSTDDLRQWYSENFGRVVIYIQHHNKKYAIDIVPKVPQMCPIDGKRPVDIASWINVFEMDYRNQPPINVFTIVLNQERLKMYWQKKQRHY